MLSCAVLLGCLTLGVVTADRAAAATVAPSASGVYVGGGNSSGLTSFSGWLGVSQSYVLDFLASDSWSSIDSATWFATQWSGSGAELVLSVPMLPASGATLSQGATGAYNSYFKTLAQQLVAAGDGSAILRLGWEMNGNWYAWSIQNGAANYAAYWRQIVNTMRAVSPNFKFDFCPNDGSSYVNGVALNPESAYPGDAYVDYVGLDVYDESWVSGWTTFTNRWTGYLTQPYGLNWQRTFAAAHGKQVSFPEWGLWPSASNGGGDAPSFVQSMYTWMSQSNLAYQMYFNASTSVMSNYPNAQSTYKQLFGPTTTTMTTTTTTTPVTTTSSTSTTTSSSATTTTPSPTTTTTTSSPTTTTTSSPTTTTTTTASTTTTSHSWWPTRNPPRRPRAQVAVLRVSAVTHQKAVTVKHHKRHRRAAKRHAQRHA